MQRTTLKLSIGLTMVALSAAPCGAAPGKRPNILFIMSDDHTTQAIGAYGSRLAKLNPTPNIDSLAKKGMRFDRTYCHNSICIPSRANILSGQLKDLRIYPCSLTDVEIGQIFKDMNRN